MAINIQMNYCYFDDLYQRNMYEVLYPKVNEDTYLTVESASNTYIPLTWEDKYLKKTELKQKGTGLTSSYTVSWSATEKFSWIAFVTIQKTSLSDYVEDIFSGYGVYDTQYGTKKLLTVSNSTDFYIFFKENNIKYISYKEGMTQDKVSCSLTLTFNASKQQITVENLNIPNTADGLKFFKNVSSATYLWTFYGY